MNYIKELRAIVGSRPLLLTGAAVIIMNDDNQLLMQHRADTNDWGLPAGYMEIGETPEEVAKREVLEETGLIVDELELLNVFSGEQHKVVYPNGDQVYCVTITYLAKAHHGEIKWDNESHELRFFDLDQLPNEILPAHQLILDNVIRKKKTTSGG